VPTDSWGIDDGWFDTTDVWRDIAPTTRDRLRAAMGDPPAQPAGVRIVRPGVGATLATPGVLRLEDGTDLGELGVLPPDLPLGLHDLTSGDGSPTTVIVSPGRCHLPPELRAWGLTMQVPTSRSRASWGIGDLADVRAVAQLVAARGGGAVGLSPLHAPTPIAPLPTSPYSPSSRRWRNPLLLRVDEVPGAANDPVVREHGQRARGLLAEPLVDRDRCWAEQQAALEHLWGVLPDRERDRLGTWRREQGQALEGWARFCALAEAHGPAWPDWPDGLRHPDGPEVSAAVGALADRIGFHAWLQLLLADQLERAAVPGVRLVQDLAIGVDPSGADAWLLQDLLALDMSVGAPPDDFEPDGQVWGLPPFVPWRLREVGYRPLAGRLRAAMAPDGGLRVDHVMGLSRLFWIPRDASPDDGGYVRFAGHELLEVLALESARAGAVVVGEDLGTVEDELRIVLARAGVLSTRVVWFEDVPPTDYPPQSLAMATTHDLPTIAGVWTGADDRELVEIGRPLPEDGSRQIRERLEGVVALPEDAPVTDVVVRVHERLGEGASMLAFGTLEDLCGVRSRPNVPGSTIERPANWSLALPLAIDDLAADPDANRAIQALAEARNSHNSG
jgi:4-alpha-glucanotransferase